VLTGMMISSMLKAATRLDGLKAGWTPNISKNIMSGNYISYYNFIQTCCFTTSMAGSLDLTSFQLAPDRGQYHVGHPWTALVGSWIEVYTAWECHVSCNENTEFGVYPGQDRLGFNVLNPPCVKVWNPSIS
jgi:hypothetical protein